MSRSKFFRAVVTGWGVFHVHSGAPEQVQRVLRVAAFQEPDLVVQFPGETSLQRKNQMPWMVR